MASYTKEGSSQELPNYSYQLAFERKNWCLVSTDPCSMALPLLMYYMSFPAPTRQILNLLRVTVPLRPTRRAGQIYVDLSALNSDANWFCCYFWFYISGLYHLMCE